MRAALSGLGLWKATGAAWTPALPTSDGGVLPHTWHYAGSGALFQDSGLTTPATADGDPIGGSTNQGSDSHSLIQATAGNKPTLKLNILNGEAVYRCDGGDWLRGAYNAALSHPLTVIIVLAMDAGSVNDDNPHKAFDSDDNTNILRLTTDATQNPDTWLVTGGTSRNLNATDGDWTIWTWVCNNTAHAVYENGGANILPNGTGTPNPDGLTLAAGFNDSNPFTGDIAELLVYASDLSTADKNQLGNYAAIKYALSWTVIT